MKLKELINKSYYTANGFIESPDSLTLLESYILYKETMDKIFLQ